MKKILAFIVAAILCLTCFAACSKKPEAPVNNESTPAPVVYDVDDAAAYLKNMYKKYLIETETAADYNLVSQVMIGGVVYKVTWTTDREDIKVLADEANKQVKIDLNEKTKVDIAYKLTATIADPDGKTASLEFELKVPKYVLSSWKEYMAMEAGKAVVVEGYIAAVHAPSEGNKYNTLYLHDVNNEGGYYIYSMADGKDLVKDLGLKKGMLVSVTGTKDIYSGTHEIKDASVNVLDTNVVDLKPLDITNTYKNATSLKDKALTDKLGMLVTIKGVEITDQDLSEKSQYLNFKLAGLTSYLRVYATDCPVSVTDAGQKKIIEEHGKKAGYSADVTGIVVMYSGAIYLNPVTDTPFAYGKKIERTPEQMVQVEMDEVKFDKDVALDKTIELPAEGKTYSDVKITWTSNSDAIEIVDGKAKITLQSEATTASITGTFTLGTITKTKTIEFNLAKKSSVTAQIAANPVPGTAYKFFMAQLNVGKVLYFNGEVANNYYGATTTNPNDAVDVYLEEATGGYYLTFTKGGTKQYITVVSAVVDGSTKYNVSITTEKPANVCTLDAALDNAPIVTIGDQKLFIGSYNTFETLSASKYSYASTNFVAHLGTVVDASTIKAEDKVAAEKNSLSLEANEFFKDAELPLALKGSIYDDVKITWTSNNAVAVVDGGKLTITLADDEQTVMITATLTCGNVTETKTFTIKVASKNQEMAPADIVNAAYALAQGATLSGGPHTLTGIIKSIDTAYSSQYKNVTVTIIVENLADKPIQCYRLKGTGADAIAVGDTITVTGTLKNYNGKIEFDTGCTLDSYKTDDAIVDELYALASGKTLEGKYALMGVIKSVDTAYSASYGNITVTIDVPGITGKPVQCYRLQGDHAADLKVGDSIIVYGTLKRYNNTYEFDAKCEIIGYTAGTPDSGDDDQGGSTTPSGSVAATFKLGTDDATKTNENAQGAQSQDGADAGTSYSETNNGYTLKLTGMSKVYKNSYDAKGNACLKLGSSKAAGTFTVTVPADVTSVKIYVAGYKSNTGKFTIGSTSYSTVKKSANGEYDVITIDTSSTKTFTFTTVSGGWRVKINTIEFCK